MIKPTTNLAKLRLLRGTLWDGCVGSVNAQGLLAEIEAYAAEQVGAATARDSAIIKMVDEARTAGRYSDAEEWDAIDAAIRARAQEEGK